MPRMRSIKISALNIVTHPHSPQTYVDLFKDAYALGKSVRYRANHYGILGFVHELKEGEPLEGIYGEIHRFIDFSTDEPWINLKKHKKADKADMTAMVLPEHLRPGFNSCRFAFFPKRHRFFFESKTEGNKSISAKTMRDMMDGLLNQLALRKAYGEVTVVIEPTSESIEKIFQIHKLERLDMEINLPNADELNAAEKKVLQRLANQNARKEEIVLVASSGMSLDPDNDTKTLAKVAAVNGVAKGRGKTSKNRPVFESTTDHPWEDTVQFNPKLQGGREVFLARVSDNLNKFMQRFRR